MSYNLELLDIHGKVVLSDKAGDKTYFSVANLMPGIYIWEAKDDLGRLSRERLIILTD